MKPPAIAFALALAGCAAKGDAEAPPPVDPADLSCTFSHRVAGVDGVAAMPRILRTLIHDRIGEMAKRGAFYNNTDVVEHPAPFQRFIRAGHMGNAWFLWFERGGIAYFKTVVIYRLDGEPGEVARENFGRGEGCARTDTLLDRTAAE